MRRGTRRSARARASHVVVTARGWRPASIGLLAVAVALTLTPPAAADSAGSAWSRVDVATIAGNSVSQDAVRMRGDTVAVTGTAAIRPPFTADAGPSLFVRRGSDAALAGSFVGGVHPYTVEWSVASGAPFSSPTALRTSVRTAELPAGSTTVTLTVRDGAGRTAQSATSVIVYEPDEQPLFSISGTLPAGVTGNSTGVVRETTSVDHAFEVPAGVSSLALELAWTNTQNLDLRVDDPSDVHDENASGASTRKPETMAIGNPAAGGWVAAIEGSLSQSTPYTLSGATAVVPPDPRPDVSIDGPVRVRDGEPQLVRASVVGGAQPYRYEWDLDGDGYYETEAGDVVSTSFERGKHPVAVRVTDAAGHNDRDLSLVAVAPAVPAEQVPVVVIAVVDTGINPYHADFAAETYPDQLLRDVTQDFTAPPSTYLPGYPQDARELPVTLGKGYRPSEDEPLWTGGHATIPLNTLHWIPGTKVIGAMDGSDRSFVNSARDVTPLLDDDGHGTAAASVAVGNLYGSCSRCLLVFVESAGPHGWVYDQPWIDLVSHSFGSLANVGAPGLQAPLQPRAAAERGQVALVAAGNGVENGFVTPEQTYLSPFTGPPWVVRVGAVERSTRKPILGTGKPVDVSSYGAGAIPAAHAFDDQDAYGFGGTSAATPITAGVAGRALGAARTAAGDTGTSTRQPGVLAAGAATATGPLSDGSLTRGELVDVVTHTAQHDGTQYALDPLAPTPLTSPDNPAQYLVEGYGIADEASAVRAEAVVRGELALPERPDEERFFRADQALRRALWGEWSGGGEQDPPASAGSVDPDEVDTLAGALRVLARSGPLAPAPHVDPVAPLRTGQGLPLFVHQDDCSNTSSRELRVSASPSESCEVVATSASGRQTAWTASTPLLQTLPVGSAVTGELVLSTPTRRPLNATLTLLAGTREVATVPLSAVVVGADGAPRPVGEVLRLPFRASTSGPAVPGDVLTLSLTLDVPGPATLVASGSHRTVIVLEAPATSSTASAATGSEQPSTPTVTIEQPAPGTRVDPRLEPQLVVSGRVDGFSEAVSRRYPYAGVGCVGRRVEHASRAGDYHGCTVAPAGLLGPGQGVEFPYRSEDLPVQLRASDVVRGALTVDGTFVGGTRISVLLGGRYRDSSGSLVFSNVAMAAVSPARGAGRQALPFEMRVIPGRDGIVFEQMAFRIYARGSDAPFALVLSKGATFFDHPLAKDQRVEVAVDDDGLLSPVTAALGVDGTWGTSFATADLTWGVHSLTARAVEAVAGPKASSSFEVLTAREMEAAAVELAVVAAAEAPTRWSPVTDTSPGQDLSTWTAVHLLPKVPAAGDYDVYARLVRNGHEVARSGPWRLERRG